MALLHLLRCFFVGALLTNAIPHLVAGLMGQRFPTPFAKPPGKGLSSAIVNLLWSFGNLLIAAVLLRRAGGPDIAQTGDVAALVLGMVVIGLQRARHFGRLNDGRGPGAA
jgi:hypothetical protein